MKPRKRIIPVHFQRKRRPTLSQLLNTASLKKKVREIAATNRYLAKCLEEAHCTIAANNTKLQEYAKNENAYWVLRMKFQGMVEAIQNLVLNAEEVKESINMFNLISSRNPFDKVKTGVSLEPNLETIEESISSFNESSLRSPLTSETSDILLGRNKAMSPINANCEISPFNSDISDVILSRNEAMSTITASQEKCSFNRETSTVDFSAPTESSQICTVDFSAPTEVYNVQQAMSALNKEDLKKNLQSSDTNIRNECVSPLTPQLNLELPETRTEIRHRTETPPTPQLHLISDMQIDFINNCKTPPLPMNFKSLLNKPTVAGLNKTHISKRAVSGIPVRRQFFPPETCNQVCSPLSNNQEDRRKTFVVMNSKEFDPDATSTSLQDNFTKNLFEVPQMKSPEKRKTFVIPAVPIPLQTKSVQISNNNKYPSDICPDEGTVHMSEDMDLTEVVSSVYPGVLPPKNNNKEMLNEGFMKPLLVNKEISPIAKINRKSEFSQENFTEISTNSKNICSKETLLSKSIEKPSSQITEFSKGTLAKTLSKICSHNNQSLKTNSLVEKNSIFEKDINIKETPILPNNTFNCSLPSSAATTNSSPKKHLDIQSSSADVFLNVLETVPDISTESDCIAPTPVKKSSIRNKALLSCQNNKTSSQCIEIKELDKNEPFLKEKENFYEFPLSDHEDETKPKAAKIKKNLKSGKAKVNSTVTILEQDINLMFQEQSRRKRSLKRRVSFAKTVNEPDNKNNENVIFDDNETNEKSSENSNENPSFKPEQNRRKLSTRRVSFASTDFFAEDEPKRKINDNAILYKTKNSEHCDNLISVPVSRRSILKKSEPPVNENVNSLSNLAELSEKSGKLTEISSEHSDNKVLSCRNSDLLGGDINLKNKRTFSGVSERNSKKRCTADDDFFDTFDVNLPDNILNLETEQENKSSTGKNSKAEEIQFITEKERNAEIEILIITENEHKTEKEIQLSADKENKIEPEIPLIVETKRKSRAKSNSKVKLSLQTTPKISSRNSKKKSKKSMNDTEIEKSTKKEPLRESQNEISTPSSINIENLGESSSRSRRTRPRISLKEPSLNVKLRRP